ATGAGTAATGGDTTAATGGDTTAASGATAAAGGGEVRGAVVRGAAGAEMRGAGGAGGFAASSTGAREKMGHFHDALLDGASRARAAFKILAAGAGCCASRTRDEPGVTPPLHEPAACPSGGGAACGAVIQRKPSAPTAASTMTPISRATTPKIGSFAWYSGGSGI